MANPSQPKAESLDDIEQPGFDATRPSQIPIAGWSQVLRRVWRKTGSHELTLASAALAFYGMLGIFPGLTALVAVYGLVFDPQDIWAQSESLAVVLPAEVHGLVFDQLASLVDTDGADLGIGLLLSLGLLLWSASTGVQNLVRGVNLAYNEVETRSFVRLRLLAVSLTVGAMAFFGIAIALIAILPQLLFLVGYGEAGQRLVTIARWPLLAIGVVIALSILYRFAPDRSNARWRWVSWGAGVAAGMWLAGSGLFAWYAERFGSYNETYGALGGVVVLLLWLYISALSILIGAELNAAMELQTAQDSTTGPEKPLGKRGALVADTFPADEVEQGDMSETG